MIRHIILLKLKPHLDNDFLPKLYQSLHEIKNEVSGILSFSFGKNLHPDTENRYSHIMMMDFVDQEYYQLYENNPQVRSFKAYLQPVLLDSWVIDYHLEMVR